MVIEDAIRKTKHEIETSMLESISKIEELSEEVSVYEIIVKDLETRLLGMTKICKNCEHYDKIYGACNFTHDEVPEWGVCPKFEERSDETEATD